MAVLINLKDARKKLNELEGSAEYNKGVTDAFNALFDLPTIEAEPIKHGYWTGINKNKYNDDEATCSICGVTFASGYSNPYWWNYCPNCGARMDGGENG